jgi:excisionase family DNA binding protein
MADNMYSAEEAAQLLGLKVRTVRNYVREGRLPGVRIGKQYRIARADLEAFTAGASTQEAFSGAQGVPGPSKSTEVVAEVSSVVQIDGIDPSARDRLERTLAAATVGGGEDLETLRVEPLYDEERRRLKLIIVGSVSQTAELLRIVDALTRRYG